MLPVVSCRGTGNWQLVTHFFTHHAFGFAGCVTGRCFAYAGACSAIICRTSGVQLPPQWPVVAVVRAAICDNVHAPSRIARSIVLYLMLLHRQTVFSPRTAGCTDSDSSSIPVEANTAPTPYTPSDAQGTFAGPEGKAGAGVVRG